MEKIKTSEHKLGRPTKKDYVFTRPKEIADVRGISYSYSLLWRFGVITVPEEVEDKLRGRK